MSSTDERSKIGPAKGEAETRRTDDAPAAETPAPDAVPEIGGRKGPDPTRYGDWEKNGRCIDF